MIFQHKIFDKTQIHTKSKPSFTPLSSPSLQKKKKEHERTKFGEERFSPLPSFTLRLFVPEISYANEDWLSIHNPSHFEPIILSLFVVEFPFYSGRFAGSPRRQQRWSRIMNFGSIKAFLKRRSRLFVAKKFPFFRAQDELGRLIMLKNEGRRKRLSSGYECLHVNLNTWKRGRSCEKL